MKILLDLDDRDFLLRQLVKLYGSLPSDLRSKKTLLPASELIVEAIEYIAYLKKNHSESNNNNNKGKNVANNQNHQIVSGVAAKYRQSILIKQPSSSAQPTAAAAAAAATTTGATTVMMQPAMPQTVMAVQQPVSSTIPLEIQGEADSRHEGPCPLECKCPLSLTNMTQRLMRFCTFAKKERASASKALTHYFNDAMVYLFRHKSNLELNALINILMKASAETTCWTLQRTTEMIIFGKGESAYPHLLYYKAWRNTLVASIENLYPVQRCCFSFNDKNLSRICINPYHYTEVEGAENNEFVKALIAFSSINQEEEGTFWKKLSVQNEFFTLLADLLGDDLSSTFIKALREGRNSPWLRQHCLAIMKISSKLLTTQGQIRIQDCTAYVQHVLFKMFRNVQEPFHKLVIQSKDCCKASYGETRKSMLCLNPWHFEIVNPNQPINNSNHICDPRIRISLNCCRYVCTICLKDVPDDSPSFVKVIIKTEKKDADEMEKDPLETENEIADALMIDIKEEATDFVLNDETEPQEVHNSKRKRSSNKDEESGGDDENFADYVPSTRHSGGSAEITRERSTRKRKIQAIFQCWKCQNKFTTNTELEEHECQEKVDDDLEDEGTKEKKEEKDTERKSSSSSSALGDGYMIFTCQYCGFSSPNYSFLRRHSKLCKSLGLKPLASLVRMSDDGHTDVLTPLQILQQQQQQERKKKRKDSSDTLEMSTKCDHCDITFASDFELKLHQSKMKCKSIQCGLCNKFYANSRTHQNHTCEGVYAGQKVDGIVSFKLDSCTPVMCDDCGLLIQSKKILKEHKSNQSNMCAICNEVLVSACKILSHPCVRAQEDLQVSEDRRLIDMSKTVSCKICGKIFVDHTALGGHMAKAHCR